MLIIYKRDDDSDDDDPPELTPDDYTRLGEQMMAYDAEYRALLDRYHRNEQINMERAEFVQDILLKSGRAIYDRIVWPR